MTVLDPRMIYPNSRFFLDFIAQRTSTTSLFSHTVDEIENVAAERGGTGNAQRRATVCDALEIYNKSLDASPATLSHIGQLRHEHALCVLGGQQAEFLGGPLFILYKIASVVRTSQWLARRLAVPVIPIFWLASEDHDFDEINHTRWLDESGAVRTVSFDWEGRGRPIEHLPISEAIQYALDQVLQSIAFHQPQDASYFLPSAHDTYSQWHARIWSRLFASEGLVLVEPRVLRESAADLFEKALRDRSALRSALRDGASAVERAGYSSPLDVETSATLFSFTENGARRRIDPEPLEDRAEFGSLSADAALRPLLADSLLPTCANILGPSELAYHALLRPLYRLWGTPQPAPVLRHGGTILSRADLLLLENLGVPVAAALAPSFDVQDLLRRLTAGSLDAEFSTARSRLQESLDPLRDALTQLDPGLENRWRQTVDQMEHQMEKLHERAARADLARRGISSKALQRLATSVHPMDKPQERVISAFSCIASYGVQWIHALALHGAPERFEHQLIVPEGAHD